MWRFTALIDGEAGADGVSFPDLPGCVAMGETVDDALFNAAEALREFDADVAGAGGVIAAPRSAEALRSDIDVADALRAGASLASVPLTRQSARTVKADPTLPIG